MSKELCDNCKRRFEWSGHEPKICPYCETILGENFIFISATPKTTEKQLLPHEIYEAGKLEGEEHFKAQTKKLADLILKEMPEMITEGGAVDVAIDIIKWQRRALELACEKIMFFLNFEDELAEKVGAKTDKLPNCTLDELKEHFIYKSKEK
jgi:hypothetical protein